MSGNEALYWAQEYPDEVTAISFAANIGITRMIPRFAESDAIQYGTMTDQEKELYKVIF